MSPDELRALADHASQAALAVTPRLVEGFGAPGNIEQKSAHPANAVTDFDKEAEEQLFDLLNSFDPGFGFYGEEGGPRGSTETFWLVDPIDGTGHYIRGLPFCTSMIALIHQGQPLVGVINDFVRGQVYVAAKGLGAQCNGQPLQVSNRGLDNAYIATEINTAKEENQLLLDRISQRAAPLSMINCGWDFAMIASGRLDGRIMKDPWGKQWDYAPGAVLIAEAGGVVANFTSPTYNFHDFDFVATTPQVYADLTEGSDPIIGA